MGGEETSPVRSGWLRPELTGVLRYAEESVLITDLAGTIVWVNPPAEAVYGSTREEITGQSIYKLLTPPDADRFRLLLGQIQQGNAIQSVEMRYLRKDGSAAELRLRLCPVLNEAGFVSGILCYATDLSTRNRAVRDERNASFLAAVVSSAEDAIISKDLNGTVMSWNPAAERIFGYTAAEMIGRPISLLIPANHPDEEPQILERIRSGERLEHYETQRRRKDGSIIDVTITISPIRDRLGRIIGASKIARETQRKRMDLAQRDQSLLAAIVSSADDAIISKDLNGIVRSWNQAAEKIFGYTAEEMIGEPITKIIPAAQLHEEPMIIERIRHGERIEHFESTRQRKNGSLVQVSLTISPIKDSMGRVIGASKIARDITQRKRWQQAEVAESFLGAIVESADDAIIGKDLDGIVTSWNRAAERLYGYSEKEIIGKPISILIPPDHPDEEPTILERIRRGERIEHYETSRIRKDGGVIHVSLTVSPIRDSLGRIIGASKIARDITESKQIEGREREVLRQAQEAKRQAEVAREQAENASQMKDEFLATVSHELRTPMTSILGWTRMLASGQLDADRQNKALNIIERNAKTQAQLIEDLLDISRIVSGKLRVDFRSIDLKAVVTAATEAVKPAAESKGIRIEFTFSSDISPIIGDADRLQQVVWNLLSNAIKFTPKGGSIRVELRRAGSQIELRVIDNGMGIAPEFVPHVFERFTQADNSITRSRGGLGMGLAIVKSLIEMHGGVVSASSEGQGQGAVFTVKLPISPLRQPMIPPRTAEQPRLQAELKQRDLLVGLKVLVVDDDLDACEFIRYVFDECGAIVETAHSAKEGLDVFDRWRPDILVSDIGMPGVDGYEFIKAIRQDRGSRVPAVALTALARIEDRVKALNSGFQMHVSKPIEPVELISIVGSLSGLVDRSQSL